MNRFYVFEMKKEDAFWLESKLRDNANFQIGPFDSVTKCCKGIYLIDDTKYQIAVKLNKEDTKRIEKYFKE